MPRIKQTGENRFEFTCPGCGENHAINGGWTMTGGDERPTLNPSVLVRSGHFVTGRADDASCWCTYNAEQREKGEPEAPFQCSVCHSWIRDGQIQFLDDSTHALAGQTVDLPVME